jgi:hypothetical protein
MSKKKKREIEEDEDSHLLDDEDEEDKKLEQEEEEKEEQDKKKKKKVKELGSVKISHNHDVKFAKLLRSRGVSTLDLLHGSRSFLLEDVILPIESNTWERCKRISSDKQLGWYHRAYQKVLSNNWLCAGIGGTPTDARAKQVALHIFIKAIYEYQERDPRKNVGRALPYWHNVYGGFNDYLRDLKSDFPSFIVISNITPTCTSLKLEKVRDALTRYTNMEIPVLVVCAGMDPFTLFSSKLYFPIKWCLNIGNPLVAV